MRRFRGEGPAHPKWSRSPSRAHAKLVLTILAAIAEFERERIGERIRDAKRHQRRTGQYLGGDRPFGWRIGEDGALIEDENEQRAFAEMRTLRSGCKLSGYLRAHSHRLRGLNLPPGRQARPQAPGGRRQSLIPLWRIPPQAPLLDLRGCANFSNIALSKSRSS